MTKLKIDQLLENTGDMALKRRARAILEEIDAQDGEKIIDVGCGDGYYLHLLNGLGQKLSLTGTDIDGAALKTAQKNLADPKIKLVEASLMEKLPFASNSFDKAVMSEVAEHLPSDLVGLKEVWRILKPGGTLVLTVPNQNYPFLWDPVNWILERALHTHFKAGFWAGIWNQHLRLYTVDQISKVVKQAGFKIERVESMTQWSLPFNHFIINIGARMLKAEVLTPETAAQINKFKHANQVKRSGLVKLFFDVSKWVDGWNEVVKPGEIGMNVFVKAIKSNHAKNKL